MKTKEQLIKEYSEAAGSVSFYNAAEGSSWSKEREGRSKAYAALKAICAECEAAGITNDELPKGFLL